MLTPGVARVLCALVLAIAAAGCAAVNPPVELPRPVPPPSGQSWYALRFRIDWPDGQAPRWHTDLLLADRVVRPVLERHAGDIEMWRFHRRAARDGAGHQFSFLFHASAATAEAVYAEVDASPDLQLALAAGRVIAVAADDPADAGRPGRADTSDPAWSAPLRRAWPHYLMGASRMWLDLVHELAAAPPGPGGQFAELDSIYAAASAAVTAVWRDEGRHAFLHHLNALFAYEPLLLRF